MKAHYEIIRNAFRPLEISESRHSEFLSFWEPVEHRRGSFITEAGKVERYFYVVLEGVQCVYILTPKGDRKVIGFSFDGSFSGIYDSFLKETGSHYFLEALTDSKLLRMNKTQYDALFDLYPEFNEWGRLVHQDLLIGRVQREVELITMDAKERFDVFMKRCPEKLLTVPQKYLASYLNMTPETFSRMRKQISDTATS
ncbi:MAG: Crp/Fnr family transcriptional regulator [bacterium]|nr:Crp/Fnr family transcriptional regulator [bacterium]